MIYTRTDKPTPAILAMNTSFIHLPLDLMQKVLAYFNSYGNPECQIVDKHR